MHYIYFLQLSNNNIYVGFSSNLKQRFQAHNDGKVPATAHCSGMRDLLRFGYTV